MKLILSRKGFDSGSGGCPSPIFPDGTMFSLPIPSNDAVTYGELRHHSENLGVINVGDVVKDLTDGSSVPASCAHLDPHLTIKTYPEVADSERAKNWRGLLGQDEAAQGHLNGQGVGKGDLFLFFGLYRRVERVAQGDREWRFAREPRKHVLWGYLQVGEKYDLTNTPGRDQVPSWANYHPHMHRDSDNNTLYAAPEDLKIANGSKAAGAGVFPRFDERLVLTEPGQSVSRWKLPRWFYPDDGKPALTYHDDPNRWERREGDSEHIYLQSVGRGQEFVLDCDHYPEAIGWASDFIRDFGER